MRAIKKVYTIYTVRAVEMSDLFNLIIIFLQMKNVLTKKYISASGESIEKFLYLKESQYGTTPPTTSPKPEQLKTSDKNSCPCPRMCCNVNCECTEGSRKPGAPPSFPINSAINERSGYSMMLPSHTSQFSSPNRFHSQPFPSINLRAKAKMEKTLNSQGRRTYDFTKEHIKSFISQDDDLKRILKDLVSVTMQKVDLLEMTTGHNENINEQYTYKPDEYD